MDLVQCVPHVCVVRADDGLTFQSRAELKLQHARVRAALLARADDQQLFALMSGPENDPEMSPLYDTNFGGRVPLLHCFICALRASGRMTSAVKRASWVAGWWCWAAPGA